MKIKITLTLLLATTLLHTADQGVALDDDQFKLEEQNQNLPDFDEGFCELEAANNAVAEHVGKERGVVSAGVVAAIWGVSKTGIAQAYFPSLFPRSGISTAIAWTIGGLAVSGGVWVAISYVRSLFALGDAHAELQKAVEEIAKTSAALAELKDNHADFANKQAEMEAKVIEAKENAIAAKTSMEGAERDLTTFIQKLELDDGKHMEIVAMLTRRVNELEGLTQELTLDRLREKAADGPDMDKLTQIAADLEVKSRRFATRDNPQANMATAAKAVVTQKKKRGLLKGWI